MAADRAQNLQDTFLNHVRKSKTPLTIFLVNGVKLQGVVTWFDNFCVLLRRDGHSQLVYKHAISTVVPARNVRITNEDGTTIEAVFFSEHQMNYCPEEQTEGRVLKDRRLSKLLK